MSTRIIQWLCIEGNNLKSSKAERQIISFRYQNIEEFWSPSDTRGRRSWELFLPVQKLEMEHEEGKTRGLQAAAPRKTVLGLVS